MDAYRYYCPDEVAEFGEDIWQLAEVESRKTNAVYETALKARVS